MATELLSDKIVLVTGAGSGLGRATAVLLAEHGAAVAVADRDGPAGRATTELVTAAGGHASFVEADVADVKSVAAMVEQVLATFGGLHCAVNCAAVLPDSAQLDDLDSDVFDRIISVNLRGVALCLKHEIQALRRLGCGGSIVNIGSTRSFRATPTMPGYTASKFAVIGLTESAALACGPDEIRVNAVCPGVMETPMVAARRAESSEPFDEYLDRVGGVLQRIGKPSEIAQAVMWLCSDHASYVTGHTLVADGGYRVR